MSRKILLVSPFPPRRNGLHGGTQAIARTVAELAEANSVRLLCLRGGEDPPTDPAIRDQCDSVEEIPRSSGRLGVSRAGRLMASLAARRPLWVGNWKIAAFEQRLRETVDTWQPDLVQFEFLVMAQYQDAVRGCPAVLVVHEPRTSAARERVRLAPAWQRPLFRRDAKAWDGYERAIFPRFDRIVCLTERDRKQIEPLAAGTKIVVIPPAGPPLLRSHSAEPGESPVILFAGNLIHPPNLDAAMRLARGIFPGVRKQCPAATLKIVGGNAPRAIRRLASRHIFITGPIPEIQTALDAAAVVAVPVRQGGGIRMKMVEALSHGKAVVASALAAEGLGICPGREFVQASSDGEFAAAIADLLKNAARRRALGSSALQWAAGYCQPGRARGAYEELYKDLEAVPRRL